MRWKRWVGQHRRRELRDPQCTRGWHYVGKKLTPGIEAIQLVKAVVGLDRRELQDLFEGGFGARCLGRRSGMVEISLAGANTQMVAAVSGRSIHSTQKILDTYIPRYMELAKEGIRRWENASGTKV